MTPWLVCPECGCAPGEDHKRGCLRRSSPPVMDYSRRPNNRSTETMRGPKPAPLQPLTEPEPRRATPVVKP